MSLQVDIRRAREEFSLEARFEVPSRGATAIFGPSGAGKTSILRCVAGLDPAATGSIHLDEECWQDSGHFLPPEQRHVGYVFQEASLFDHLDVAGNIDFGLRRSKGTGTNLRDELIDLLALEPLLERRVHTLSGGERRRVAIVRALAPAPRLLLLDEPLAGLDRARKAELMPYLERLNRQLDLPILLVSHDLDEVARLADHLVLLEHGRVAAAGPLADTLARLDLSLALAEDASAVLTGRVRAIDDAWGLAQIELGDTELIVPAGSLEPGMDVRLRIAARDVSIALDRPTRSSVLNVLPATVQGRSDRPPLTQLELALADDTRLLARITCRSAEHLDLSPGMDVYAQIKSVAVLP